MGALGFPIYKCVPSCAYGLEQPLTHTWSCFWALSNPNVDPGFSAHLSPTSYSLQLTSLFCVEFGSLTNPACAAFVQVAVWLKDLASSLASFPPTIPTTPHAMCAPIANWWRCRLYRWCSFYMSKARSMLFIATDGLIFSQFLVALWTYLLRLP